MARLLTRTLCTGVLAAGLMFLSACESDGATSQPAASLGAINDTCPIMGGDIDPNAKSASYEGATIGFCCSACSTKWDSWSDAQKMDFVAKNR